MNQFELDHYFGTQYNLENWVLVNIKGEDVVNFLQGQTTNNIKNLGENDSCLTVRLDRSGRIKSYFFVIKNLGNIYLFLESKLLEETLEDLNKYIIMEDVDFEVIKDKRFFLDTKNINAEGIDINFFGERGVLIEGNQGKDYFSKTLLNGFVNTDNVLGKIVNSTYLNEFVNYSKGCFLGQEPVAKINNNRGGAYYPVFLIGDKKIEQKIEIGKVLASIPYENIWVNYVEINRENRISKKEVNLNDSKYVVEYLPFYSSNTNEEKSNQLFHLAVKLFGQDNEDEAIKFLQRSIELNPKNADSYESLGVIFGRQGKYQEAIKLMDQLEKADPESVMAFTNRSLYLMKLGKIEEAEEQKSLATLKSFKKFGDEAKEKKAKEDLKHQQEQELLTRERMFKQVLELDSEDEIANFGIGEIAFKRKNYELAIEKLSFVIDKNPKHSVAYLVLSKAYKEAKDIDNCIRVLNKGIEVASKNGDLMPANEMQSILIQINS